MHRLYPASEDFEATIRILTEAEGGRHTPAFNGIRWDFCYASDDPAIGLYMIWPDFFSTSGDSLPTDLPLPQGVDLTARMFILVDESRAKVHRSRIEPGVEFNCYEGARRVATGRVSRLTGLHSERAGAV